MLICCARKCWKRDLHRWSQKNTRTHRPVHALFSPTTSRRIRVCSILERMNLPLGLRKFSEIDWYLRSVKCFRVKASDVLACENSDISWMLVFMCLQIRAYFAKEGQTCSFFSVCLRRWQRRWARQGIYRKNYAKRVDAQPQENSDTAYS